MKHFRQYLTPGSIEEAITLRREVGPKAIFIAGGTTVVVYASKGVDVLIDVTGLGLGGWSDHGDLISIGATTRLAEMYSPEIDSAVPVLSRALAAVGSPLLRNMATLGGSLTGIFLPSDIGVTLLALGAEIHLQGESPRKVAIDDLLEEGWLSGYELITEVRIGKHGRGRGGGFAKFGRSTVDIGLVNAAAAVEVSGRTIKHLRIAVGQSRSKPVLLTGSKLEAEGKEVTLDLIKECAENARKAVKAKADFRASADFRGHLVSVLVARALGDAVERAGIDLAD